MSDDPRPDSTSHPTPEVRSGSERFNLNAPRPTGRPIYESHLLPTRKRRRFSPWLVVPGLLAILFAVLYFLHSAPHPRPSVSTAGMIVYAAGSRLWIAPSDGTGARPLTTGQGADSSPTFTADGRQIAFLSNRAGGQNQVYLVDGDGKNLTQITRNSGAKTQPAFAPGSNTLLGFVSGGTLAYTDVTKGDVTLLLPTHGQSAHPSTANPDAAPIQDAAVSVASFAWKPVKDNADPGMAAVLESNGVQTLALLPDLSSPPRLTQNDQPDGPPLAAADSVSIGWAPDGSRLAVALLHVQGLPAGQYASGLLQFDGQGNVQRPLMPLLRDSAIGPQNPVFSPDGSLIAFELWRQPDLASRTRLGLFLISSTVSGAPHLLAKGEASAAQFSPDGKQVFYLARRPDGGHDLWRVNLDGTGAKRVSDGQLDVTGYAISPQTLDK